MFETGARKHTSVYITPHSHCIISGCGERRATASGGVCDAHREKLVACSWEIEGLSFWMRDGEIGYESVHSRLRALRGPAREQKCPCGKRAVDYSYDHSDHDELLGVTARAAILVYSLDQNCYQALCRACHRRRDEVAVSLAHA